MRISDRADNQVIVNVHPLAAAAALQLSAGDKHRIEYVDPFTVIVHSNGDLIGRLSRYHDNSLYDGHPNPEDQCNA